MKFLTNKPEYLSLIFCLQRVTKNDTSEPLKELPSPPRTKKSLSSDSENTPNTSSTTPQTPSLNQTTPSPRSGIPKPPPPSTRSLPPARPSHTPPPNHPAPSPPRSPSPPPPKAPSAPLPGIGGSRRPLTPSNVPKQRSQKIFVPTTPPAFKTPSPPSLNQTAYTDYDERTLPALKQ